jgi:organic hydroperoxide reductase OsmC/OhrA
MEVWKCESDKNFYTPHFHTSILPHFLVINYGELKQHVYHTNLDWTGNTGTGTQTYRGYERSHVINVEGKAPMSCSSDPSFRGDKSKYNPEEMFVASLSSCHMLWFLHVCSEAGVIVLEYSDSATGIMLESDDGNGRFAEVVLHPKVKVKEGWMLEKTEALHEKARQFCFISNSCNFPVRHEGSSFL